MTQRIGSAVIQDSAITNDKVAQNSLELNRINSTAGGFTFRNKIINGKIDVAQRGTSFTSQGYTLDRWFFNTHAGPAATVSQQSDVPGNNEFLYSLRVTVTTADTSIAAGDFGQLFQRIEGYNARDLIGRTFTLSFWVRSSKTGVHCVAFKNSGADRSYVVEYTVNAANTWEYKTVTVSGGLITAGTWDWTNGSGLDVRWVLASGSTFQTTAGAWQTGDFLGTANQVNCLDTVGNVFAIAGVQLEVGSVATPFEHRPFGAEVALCQWYYQTGRVEQRFNYSAVQELFVGNNLRVTMRATPTVAYSSITAVNISSHSVSAITNNTVNHMLVSPSAGGAHSVLDYIANAEL